MLMSVVVMGIGFVNGEWVLAHLSLSTLRRLCPGVPRGTRGPTLAFLRQLLNKPKQIF